MFELFIRTFESQGRFKKKNQHQTLSNCFRARAVQWARELLLLLLLLMMIMMMMMMIMMMMMLLLPPPPKKMMLLLQLATLCGRAHLLEL